MALKENGNTVIWGYVNLTNIPAGMAGVKAISAGLDHNIVVESGILTPVIFTEPVSQIAPAGSNVTFTALGLGVAGLTYQWQSNGVTITGQTGASLTLTNVGATNQASYDVVVTTDGVSITSDAATFLLVVAPGVASITPTNTGLTWINSTEDLTATVTNIAQSPTYPIQYYWQFNGTNVLDSSDSYFVSPNSSTNEGTYTVGISNMVGGTNLTWSIRIALPGMVEAWGSDAAGECNRPATMTNVAGIAAGEYQSVAVTDIGTVAQWGQYSNSGALYSVTNSSVATQPPTTGVVAVAAGLGQALALTTSNTVIAWGFTGAPGATISTGVQTNDISAIACGSQFDLALSNGTVIAWGNNTYGQTSVPSTLSHASAIAAGAYHALALSNGTVVAWGYNGYGQTNVPANLTNVVAVAAGDEHSLALQSNGIVVAWGNNSSGQINVPAGLSNVMAIAAGSSHSVALLNNGTLVEWGANSSGQTTVPGEFPTIISESVGSPPSPISFTNPPIVVKLIAAGGNHTIAGIFSPLVQYPVNVSKDLLVIYNSSSTSYSSNVCAYYMAHRPMVSNANRLGISCATNEGISWSAYTSTFVAPIVTWLSNNPTLRPQYVILFQDLPSRFTNVFGKTESVQFDMNAGYNPYFSTIDYATNWMPFVTSINMNGVGGTNDCIAYINKLTNMAASSQTLFIRAPVAYYGTAYWYFDDAEAPSGYIPVGSYGVNGVESNGVLSSDITYTPENDNIHITKGTNVAGYFTWGTDGGLDQGYPTNQVSFFEASAWYLIATAESFNGQRVPDVGECSFLQWFASNAFAGSSYSNTPIGAISHVDEPYEYADNTYNYFGLWVSEKSFAICAWAGQIGTYSANGFPKGYTDFWFQATGDPFVIQ